MELYASSLDPLRFADDDGMPSKEFRKFIDNLKFAAKHAPDSLIQGHDERVQLIAIAAHLGISRDNSGEQADE